jgi:protoporphyrinogen oxidase
MLRKAAPGRGYFYYPRLGFGAISERLFEEAQNCGAQFLFNSRIAHLTRDGGRVTGISTGQHVDAPDHVWSTAPLNWLAQSFDPPAPANVLEAAARMRFRSMILIYLTLEQGRFSEYDAHYFPDEKIPISRLSEPKNYGLAEEPPDATVLCAELPCEAGSSLWMMDDLQLGELARQSLEASGIPVRAPIRRVATRRLERAYPLYEIGYESRFALIDEWLNGFENLITFGRQGLFAHDNTHHALFMAYSAVDCLDANGAFDRERWLQFRRQFESHVVED